MNKYLIIDNNSQSRNTVVFAITECEALSEGASRLKTTNIRIILAAEQTIGTINKLGFTM